MIVKSKEMVEGCEVWCVRDMLKICWKKVKGEGEGEGRPTVGREGR